MKSEDTSDILFNKLFKFKLKRRYKDKKNILQNEVHKERLRKV